MFDAGTQRRAWFRQWFPESGEMRSGEANPPGRLPGKAAKDKHEASVPQTDTGGRVEHTQALG